MKRCIEMCTSETEDNLDTLFQIAVSSLPQPLVVSCDIQPYANAKTLNHCDAEQPSISPAPALHCVRTIKNGTISTREASLLLAGLFKIPLRRGLLLLLHFLIIIITISRRRPTSSLIARPLNLLPCLRERRLDLWKQFDQIIELVHR